MQNKDSTDHKLSISLDLVMGRGLLLRLLLDPLDLHQLPQLRPLHPGDVEPLELLASLVIKHGLRRLS